MASASTKAKTEIRELSVALAMADAAWCTEAFDTFEQQREFVDEYSRIAAPQDGFDLADRCRSYGIISEEQPLASERMWNNNEITTSSRNYALGKYLAEYFAIYPGSVEWIEWAGPDNNSGDDYWAKTPADVMIKLAGTPAKTQIVYERNSDDYGAFHDDSVISYYDEPEADILISLKDGSKILGNLGFANVAGLLLNEEYKDGMDFFDLYAHKEYEAWFSKTLKMCAEWLSYNDMYFVYESNASSRNYYIEYDGDDTLKFHVEDRNTGKVSQPAEISVSQGTLEYYRGPKLHNRYLRKCLSKWIEVCAFCEPEYLDARRQCCRLATQRFTNLINTGQVAQRFYGLTGSRMTSYYYAAVVGKEFKLYQVPTYYDMVDYPLSVELQDVYDGANQDNVTSAVVPFILRQSDFEVESRMSMNFSFTDGEFSAPPQVKIHAKGETVKMYVPCESVYWESLAEEGL